MFCIFLIKKKKKGRCMMTFNKFIWLSQYIQLLSQYFMQMFPSMIEDTNQKDKQPSWLTPSEATSSGSNGAS